MTHLLGGILAALSALALFIAALRESAYRRGFQDGHKAGLKDEENWWLNAEAQIDQARQKIWREER